MTKKQVIGFFSLMLVAGVSVWGPEVISRCRDRSLLGSVYREEVETAKEGYRYELSPSEKLYVFSQALASQDMGGSYTFVENSRGVPGGEIPGQTLSAEAACEFCNQGLQDLKDRGILPDSVQETGSDLYDAVLYTAIDVREPRNYVTVWRISLSDRIRGVGKENRLMDVYMDADDGKIYEVYARTEWQWEQIDPDAIAKAWCNYLGLSKPEPDTEANPLTEATPYFRKYWIPGVGEEKTVITVGYYEGIREVFIKLSR